MITDRHLGDEQCPTDDRQRCEHTLMKVTYEAKAHESVSAGIIVSLETGRKIGWIERIPVSSMPSATCGMAGLTWQIDVPSVRGGAQKVPESRRSALRPGWLVDTCRAAADTQC